MQTCFKVYHSICKVINPQKPKPFDFPETSTTMIKYDSHRVTQKIEENLIHKWYEFNCISNPELKELVIDHLAHHNITHDEVERFFFKLMRDCFNYDPDRRPK